MPNDLYCALKTTTGVWEYTSSLEGPQEGFKGGKLLISVVILCAFIGRLIGTNKSMWFFIETLFGLFRKVIHYERGAFVPLTSPLNKKTQENCCLYKQILGKNCSGKPTEVKLGPREKEWWEV